MSSAALAVNTSLYAVLPYHPLKNFTPVVLAAKLPSLVVVPPSLPVHNIKELNEYLAMNPKNVSYASAGNGTPSHLGVEMYKKTTGLNITHVPYRGGAPALTDLVAGRVQLMFAILPEAMPFVKDGKLRAIAVTTPRRAAQAPEVPTIAESGLPNYDLTAWYAFVVPAGTPPEAVSKLNAAINSAFEDPDVRKNLVDAGFEVGGGTPESLNQLMRSELEKWDKVIKEANVELN